MTQPIRWGVLGAAKFAHQHMARAIHAAEGAKFAALATSTAEKAAPFQAFQPDVSVFLDYDALLADPAIDAVYIPLPNHLHVDWTLKALQAGKHVLCEKPLAMSADEFDAVIAKRDETGLIAAEAYMIVHHPQWIKAREIVQSGVLGDLMLVDSVFSYDNRTDPGNIRNRPDTGGGSLPDIGVYTFGGARFVTGQEPTAVQAADIRRENGVDVFAHVTADFPSFRYSSITSMRMFTRQYMAFHGTGGVMTIHTPFNAAVHGPAIISVERAGHMVETYRWPGVNHYVLQVENFGRAVRGEIDYPCPLEFSRGTQAMMDMVWASEQGAT